MEERERSWQKSKRRTRRIMTRTRVVMILLAILIPSNIARAEDSPHDVNQNSATTEEISLWYVNQNLTTADEEQVGDAKEGILKKMGDFIIITDAAGKEIQKFREKDLPVDTQKAVDIRLEKSVEYLYQKGERDIPGGSKVHFIQYVFWDKSSQGH
jgi:hypothetical protein